jgi:hypothetical protein
LAESHFPSLLLGKSTFLPSAAALLPFAAVMGRAEYLPGESDVRAEPTKLLTVSIYSDTNQERLQERMSNIERNRNDHD